MEQEKNREGLVRSEGNWLKSDNDNDDYDNDYCYYKCDCLYYLHFYNNILHIILYYILFIIFYYYTFIIYYIKCNYSFIFTLYTIIIIVFIIIYS